jgi:fermentation-respiration switch protein FrsA (DUF1100 family)
MIATLVTIGVVGYVLLGLLLYVMQEKMIFLPDMPGRSLDYSPANIGLEFEDVRIETEDGVLLHGWYVPATEPRGAVLFLHGNAGNISHRLDSIAIFHDLALDTLIIDYRGYGQSEGKPGERGIYLDGRAAWSYLVGERGQDPQRIVIFGRSMGGAVAARLARNYAAAGVVVESSFTSAVDMAGRLYPFMPVRLVTRLDFPVASDLAGSLGPVLVVHSRNDEIIPFAMGQSLYDAAPDPKQFLELAGDHNGGFLLDEAHYRSGLGKFLTEIL